MDKNSKKPRSRAKPAPSIPPFLHKVYEILENQSFQDLVSWNSDGNAFIIKNVTEFTEKVLPKYFKHNNFASFVRQLNLYDFHKSRYENNGNEFYHKNFKRGEKNLLAEIKRKMPNENTMDSPSGFFNVPEEAEPEKIPQELFQFPTSFNDLISRQERLEKAMKLISTQNKQLIKENKVLWSEVTTLKTKQSNTEKATRTINGQNTQLLKENRYLWGELVLNRERYERQVEKLMLFLISIIRCSETNSRPVFKKKNFRGTTLNASSEEDPQFENAPTQKTDNNPFSVLPMKKMNKFLTNKKTKSQLDKLLERLEQEGIHNLFSNKPYIFGEKDLLMKFTSLFDLDGGDSAIRGLDLMTEKRPAPIDHALENEEPRGMVSKMCKIENNKRDSAVAIITEEPNSVIEKVHFPKTPILEGLAKNNMVDLPSPMQLDGMYDFELSPLKLKCQLNLGDNDFLHIPETLISHFNKHPHAHNESNDEDEDEKDMSDRLGKMLFRSCSASQPDMNNKSDPNRLEDMLSSFSPCNFLNTSGPAKQETTHSPFFNFSGALTQDPNS